MICCARWRRPFGAAVWFLAVTSVACTTPAPGGFSVANARAHVEMLAGTIGIRPVGTDANRRAREYIVSELARRGFDVHVQEADGVRPEFGTAAHVFNIVAIKAGRTEAAAGIVAHYDSTPFGPGAADDGLGVAVAIEAGRVLAADPDRRYSLVVALTDGEEAGLMGAAALVKDPVWKRVKAYLNIEAVGTSGPGALFETGPGNTWLVQAWARSAPFPFGASYATEIYKRLPNDTDFSILRRDGTPGLNFAPLGNSYAYHTHLDTPDRVSDATIGQTGEGVVATVRALDREDVSRRSADWTLYFDISGLGALVAGSWAAGLLGVLGLVTGLGAWVRLLAGVRRRAGLGRLLATALVALTGTVAVALFTLAAAWGLRAVREVYHPWYAFPSRFFALLAAAGALGGWLVTRLAARLPARFRGCSDPAATWCVVLPVWIILGLAMVRWLPAASYLVTVPLAAAGLALLLAGGRQPSIVRLASLVPTVVALLLWFRPAWSLLHFMVANLGRQGSITPVFVYPALLLVTAVGIVVPVLAMMAGWTARLARPAYLTLGLVLTLAGTFALAFFSPAYTNERPLLRSALYTEDATSGTAFYEVSASEPDIDAPGDAAAPRGWERVTGPVQISAPVPSLGGPFVYRAMVRPVGEAAATVQSVTDAVGPDRLVTITVVPRKARSTVTLVLPKGVTPIESSMAGMDRKGRWQASFTAPLPGGAVFRLRLRAADVGSLANARVVILTMGLPGGGDGFPGLPSWLPRERSAWSAGSVVVLPIP